MLVLCVIGLIMTAAMMTMVSHGTFVSAQQRRFRTAVDASLGGVQTMFHLLSTRGNVNIPASDLNLVVNNAANFANKINYPLIDYTGAPSLEWAGLDSSLTIDPAQQSTYDMRIELGTGRRAYMVYMKIVDTVEGNSSADEGLLKAGVVNSGSGEITVMSVPYLYTIEMLSQTQVNAGERSRVSVLYQY